MDSKSKETTQEQEEAQEEEEEEQTQQQQQQQQQLPSSQPNKQAMSDSCKTKQVEDVKVVASGFNRPAVIITPTRQNWKGLAFRPLYFEPLLLSFQRTSRGRQEGNCVVIFVMILILVS